MNSIRRAFAANLLPALALWSVAGLLVAFYYLNGTAHGALDLLAGWKARLGLGFSMPAQALAGAVLPFVFQRFQRGQHRRTRGRDLPFLMLGFALLGAATDFFYRFQALLWGDDAQLRTLLLKVACDLLLYTPLFCMPWVVLCFAFKDCGYSLKGTRAFLGRGWMIRRVGPVYASALIVWTPTVFALYALPLALQFPFQAIIQCLWGLILLVLTAQEPQIEGERPLTSG